MKFGSRVNTFYFNNFRYGKDIKKYKVKIHFGYMQYCQVKCKAIARKIYHRRQSRKTNWHVEKCLQTGIKIQLSAILKWRFEDNP
jgi:hypothetical protein